ncbi:DEKNAAC105157 [Brettanomyces naardenensis]|uniref:DEKNAAC105157 n=1 Tax=Brettanomyces naardenensis TaxID=13370 RepID=A0A448YSR4_BRENA|nr:DEKNAAC105157 [Brettanomyces naardenensis]
MSLDYLTPTPIPLTEFKRSLSPTPTERPPPKEGSSTSTGFRGLRKAKKHYKGEDDAVYTTTYNRDQEGEHSSDSDNPLEEEDYVYPTDKRECWLVVFGSFMGLLPTWGICNSIGIIQTYVLENELKDVSTTTVSWIFSMFACLSMISAIFSGCYFDLNGPGRLICIGTVLFVGSLLAVANCTTTYQFILAFGLGLGVGAGILGSPLIGAIPHYFPRSERATAIALAGSGGCLGGCLWPLMLRKSFTTIGYAWSMRAVALISLGCLTLAFFLVKERELVEKKPLTAKQTALLYLTSSFDVKALLSDRKYLFNVIGCVFSESTLVVGNGYFSYICVRSGFSQSESFLFVTLFNAIAIPSRWISGIIADRWFGPYNVIIVLLFMTSFVELVIWLPFKSNRVAMYLFCVLYGITYGGIMSLIPSCCSQVVRQEKFGARYATQYALTGIALLGLMPGASGIIGSGVSSSRNSCYIGFVSALGILGATGYFVTRTMSVGWRLVKY